MKTLISFFCAFLLVPFAFHGQDRDIQKLFNRYEKVDGFRMTTEVLDLELDLEGDLAEFLDRIQDLYILKFDNEKGNSGDREAFQKKLLKLCDKKGFKDILDISGEGSFRMMSRSDKDDQTTDFLMITHGKTESMFLWATG
jgi:hypothetical protein